VWLEAQLGRVVWCVATAFITARSGGRAVGRAAVCGGW
jgi:hypothetical protein